MPKTKLFSFICYSPEKVLSIKRWKRGSLSSWISRFSWSITFGSTALVDGLLFWTGWNFVVTLCSWFPVVSQSFLTSGDGLPKIPSNLMFLLLEVSPSNLAGWCPLSGHQLCWVTPGCVDEGSWFEGSNLKKKNWAFFVFSSPPYSIRDDPLYGQVFLLHYACAKIRSVAYTNGRFMIAQTWFASTNFMILIVSHVRRCILTQVKCLCASIALWLLKIR